MFEKLKIVELAMYLPLPYAGGFFARMGATVIKVESPFGGDPLKELDANAYSYLNKNKILKFFDLKNEHDKDQVLKIISESDVVLNGFRRDFQKKIGLDYNSVKEINPNCVFLTLAGYEKGAKDENLAGHDLNFVSLSGIMQSIPDLKKPFPFQLTDMSGALWAIIGTFMMLEKRKQTGMGGELDISLLRSVTSFFPFFYSATKGGDIENGIFSGNYACYNVYETRDDKKIAVGSVEKKFFKRLLDVMKVDCTDNMLYDFAFQGKLIQDLQNAFKKYDAEIVLEMLEKEDICVTPVLSKEEFFGYLKQLGVETKKIDSFLFCPLL